MQQKQQFSKNIKYVIKNKNIINKYKLEFKDPQTVFWAVITTFFNILQSVIYSKFPLYEEYVLKRELN